MMHFSISRALKTVATTLALTACVNAPSAFADVVVDFEDLSLSGPNSFWNGSDLTGGFASGGVEFANRHNPTWGSWSGFSYSNVVNTTDQSWTNQYAAITGAGAGGSATYAVASGYWDLEPNFSNPVPFDPANPAHLNALPHLTLPEGYRIDGLSVTNTTYTALTMLNGDSYGFTRKFGGDDGNAPDFLRLTVHGTDALGQVLAEVVEFYLADFRFEDNSLDFILTDWADLDLTPLSGAARLHFNLASSDVGDYGMNTPAYFAIDNIRLTVIPEPSSLTLCLSGIVMAGLLTRRISRRGTAR